ncbi:MAG: TonB-dependent receptor, partial [Flavisolibacter sp.]|nr:TonB-dependent receptor [Flavisolibacter sp.]
ASVTDPEQGDRLAEIMRNDINLRQINWQRLYEVNRNGFMTIKDANGTPGNDVSGNRSRYILEERVVNTQRLNLNSVINTRLSGNIDLSAGASFQTQKNHYFKRVNDLLGGDFYVNLNQFAERDFPANNLANQNDLDNPNRILKVGDKFGYDYNININKAAAWAQGVFRYSKVDFFLAGQLSHTSFQRVGNVRTGLFPDNSKGEAAENVFNNYGIKAGATYKIDGRNYIYARGGYVTRAPYFENVYVSPRTRNATQENITSETIQTAEAGYVMNAPGLKLRLSGYYTRFANGMDVMTFYHDVYQNLVNYAISGIDKLHFGGEFGVEATVAPGLSVNAAAALGRYYFDSKQNAIITVDNSSAVLGQQIIYAENFRVPSTPQEAYSLGLTYRSPHFWFVSLTGNYFDQNWLSMNPLRRTYDAVRGLEYKGEEYNRVFNQTKFDAAQTLDFFGGWSYRMPRSFRINNKSTYLVFNVGVNNILNQQDIETGGFEQLRFDASTGPGDKVNIDKFPPRIFYAYGRNYFASVTLRF